MEAMDMIIAKMRCMKSKKVYIIYTVHRHIQHDGTTSHNGEGDEEYCKKEDIRDGHVNSMNDSL